MMSVSLDDTLIGEAAAIEGFSSRIEDVFARVGSELGRGHTLFKELNRGLAGLSEELSGAEIEAAATALQEIAASLSRLAEALPSERALLETIGSSTADASSLLKPLFKQIQMITIIARSARIEAAALDGDRDGFIVFTQEVYDLGKAVHRLIENCARDQQRLSEAVTAAFGRQKEFAERYRAQLLSGSHDLASAHSELREQRSTSAGLADLADTNTRTIAAAVASSIISLQAADSTRQRLEHISHGLRLAAGAAPSIQPGPAESGGMAHLICQLQALQLKDADQEFGGNVGQIVRALSDIRRDASNLVGRGRSLFGGEDNASASFLDRIKQALARASTLIATCENAGRSVDEALTIVEETMAKFRHAISELAEAVIDITLISMNASLKAGNLGNKGGAFVVIANELKATAERVSGDASRLKPVLDAIERSSNDLRELRRHADPAQLNRLEPVILQALREIKVGNGRLDGLMSRLVDEGVEFEDLMNSALQSMAQLSEGSSILPAAAASLDVATTTAWRLNPQATDEACLDDLFVHYTMARERDVHRQFLQRLGLQSIVASQQAVEAEVDDGVLLF